MDDTVSLARAVLGWEVGRFGEMIEEWKEGE
jgi:hypothetical protein